MIPSNMSRTLAIRAFACMLADQAADALNDIEKCRGPQNMSQEEITQSQYLRYSGGIMLLARTLWLQDKRSEAPQAGVADPDTATRRVRGESRFQSCRFSVDAGAHDET